MRRHRLEVAAGQHHALGPAGRAAGADDHRHVVDGGGVDVARRGRGQPGTPPSVSAPSTVGRRGTPGGAAPAGRRGSAATSGANADWNSSTVQSNRSSSSRFSAASLRGLIGHHTAPARLMPKTQVNATGSLADRIATLSPGATPARGQGRRDPVRSAPAPRRSVSVAPSVVRQGASGPERGALVEVVDQPHDGSALRR